MVAGLGVPIFRVFTVVRDSVIRGLQTIKINTISKNIYILKKVFKCRYVFFFFFFFFSLCGL